MSTQERKPKGYWTYERCMVESAKFEARKKFKFGCMGAYQACLRNGWLDDFFPPNNTQPIGYWTYERCKKEASKFRTRKQFNVDCGGAYKACRRMGWLDELLPVSQQQRPRGYWTYERVLLEVELHGCKTRQELIGKNRKAYIACYRNGWLSSIFGENNSLPDNTWTFDACKAEARKYMTKFMFRMKSLSAYSVASRKGWLREICSHMPETGGQDRCVYQIIDRDRRMVYVGITYSFESRWRDERDKHNRSDIVAFKETSSYERVTEYIKPHTAARYERAMIKAYKKAGWKVLNRTKGGELGGGRKAQRRLVCKQHCFNFAEYP